MVIWKGPIGNGQEDSPVIVIPTNKVWTESFIKLSNLILLLSMIYDHFFEK